MVLNGFAPLDCFHLIPGIGIFSSGRRASELMLPFNHLCQACSGPWLCEFPVGTFQLPSSRKICTSFGLLEVEIGKTESWRNTYCGVDLKKTRFVPGGFSCTNSNTFLYLAESCGWVQQKHFEFTKNQIQISRAFATLVQPIVRNSGRDPLFFIATVGATHCFLQHL